MFDVENVGYLAQKNNAKTVDMHEYNETVRDLCKMTIDRYKSIHIVRKSSTQTVTRFIHQLI